MDPMGSASGIGGVSASELLGLRILGSSRNSGPFWGPLDKGAVLSWGPKKRRP